MRTLNNTTQRQKNAGHGFTTAGEAPQLTPHLLGVRGELGERMGLLVGAEAPD